MLEPRFPSCTPSGYPMAAGRGAALAWSQARSCRRRISAMLRVADAVGVMGVDAGSRSTGRGVAGRADAALRPAGAGSAGLVVGRDIRLTKAGGGRFLSECWPEHFVARGAVLGCRLFSSPGVGTCCCRAAVELDVRPNSRRLNPCVRARLATWSLPDAAFAS